MVLVEIDNVKFDDFIENTTTRKERCLDGFTFFVRAVTELDTVRTNVYLQRTQKNGLSVES